MQVKGCLVPQQYGVPELGSVPLVAAVQAQQLFNRHPSSQTPNPACSEDSNQSLFEDSRHYEPAVCDPMTQGDSMETESFMDELRHSSGEGVAQAPPRRRNGHAVGGAAAAAAAAAVDRAKVASMLDALALQQPLFMSSKYVKIADLNRGASGFVQLAQNTETWERVAIKFIPRGEHSKAVLCRELLHLSECGQHPNIVQLKEVFLTPHHLGIAMEYVDGGDLAQWVQMHRIPERGLPEGDARWLFQQIALAVDFCHRLGIALRDIKLDNCLIDSSRGAPLVKLCDFGYSKAENLGSGCKTACGTPEYMAPEVLTEAKYKGNAADVWSLGVMLYVMIEGAFPFRLRRQRYQMQKMIGRIVNAEYKRPTHASLACQDLLAQMLHPKPEARITVSELLSHPWFLRDLPPGTQQVNDRLEHDVHARVSEQTRNEIRHVVDLCNDHAPIAQCRTARPVQEQAAPAPQPPSQQEVAREAQRQVLTQRAQQEAVQQQALQAAHQRQQTAAQQAYAQHQHAQHQHAQVAAVAAAQAQVAAQHHHHHHQQQQQQQQRAPNGHSADMQRLLDFGGDSPAPHGGTPAGGAYVPGRTSSI